MKFSFDESVFVDDNTATLYIFAFSYNILEIENGTANLLFI